MTTLAFIGTIGLPELIILGLLGLLIFGKRLPEVGRNIGKGIVEFKKGLAGMEDDANRAAQAPPPPAATSAPPQLDAPGQGTQAPAQPSEQKTRNA